MPVENKLDMLPESFSILMEIMTVENKIDPTEEQHKRLAKYLLIGLTNVLSIDLSNYEPREVPKFQEFNNWEQMKWNEVQTDILRELNQFKDSFGRDWEEWNLSDLKYD